MSSTVPTQIVDKNGKNTTVHKKVDDGGKSTGRTVPIVNIPHVPDWRPENWTDRDDNNADIDELVSEAVANGMLRPIAKMNGDRNYATGERFIGRLEDGSRVFVEMRLEHVTKSRKTTDLEDIEESWDFSMTGTIKKANTNMGGGQIKNSLRGIVTSPLGVDGANELADIWDDNHLNGLNAGTEKQQKVVADLKSKGMNTNADNYKEVASNVEDDRGYKYGSTWLHNDVPSGIIEHALTLLSKGTPR